MYDYFYYFVLYSIAGFLLECCYVSFKEKRFVYRGFLLGPYCPIYGFGMCFLIAFLTPLTHHFFLLFLGAAFLTTVLEYLTGVILERVFSRRWWDYSDRKYNIGGFITPSMSICWGLLGSLTIGYMQPYIAQFVKEIPKNWGYPVAYAIFFVILGDTILTTISTFELNKKLKDWATFKKQMEQTLKEVIPKGQEKLDLLRMNTLEDFFKTVLGEMKQSSSEKKEEIILLFENFQKKYKTKISAIQNRMIRAYPKMKSTRFNDALEEMKENVKKLLNKK